MAALHNRKLPAELKLPATVTSLELEELAYITK